MEEGLLFGHRARVVVDGGVLDGLVVDAREPQLELVLQVGRPLAHLGDETVAVRLRDHPAEVVGEVKRVAVVARLQPRLWRGIQA